MHICMIALVAVFIGCSEDDPVNPDPDPTPVVDPDNGEVTFVITNESGSGTGTVDAPAEVSNGDTLSMVIRQKSSYTDSDGTVFTCEPEAKFSTHAVLDTVYAQNEDLLTKIEEDSDVVTSKEGENPVRNLIKQTINVGPQTIKADLDYEVYTYINKAQQAIEMPYAKLNEISLGSPSADEEGADAQQTRAEADITKAVVTLTPLAQTRAVVSDTTLYNVNVLLYEDVEIENAKDQTTQQIVISVNYIGAVVTSMEVPDPENSSLSYDIEIAKGTGEGTEASPAIVSAGDSLRVEINQLSGYSDTDGTKVERNPKASIVLYANSDVVYAKSKDELTALVEDGTPKTSKEGENPVRNIIEQTPTIGTKSLYQKAIYEVYSYTNKAEKLIEMPFVEIEPADAPTVTIAEATGTRAVVNDTTFYDITALIKYKIVSKNIIDSEATDQIIACAVKYRGAVVNSTEIPDEDNGTVSFEISAEGGDGQGTSASPYVVSAGNTFNLQISQRSSYTDLDWSVYECEPQASVSLYAEQDIVYAESLEQLTSLAGDADVTSSQDGTNPVSHTLTQVFNVGGQSIHFDLGYEVYTYTNQANTEVEMPYIRVNEAGYQGTQTQNQTAVRAAVRGATVSATPSTRATVSDTTLYDVTVRFNLELESVNAAETSNQTIAFAVTYPGAVITETEVDEPDLVSVEYRTGYVWEEAHDNLPLLYYATVYRDRHYSNGDVITDTFVDAGHMVSLSQVRYPDNVGTYSLEDGVSIVFDEQTSEISDQRSVTYSNLQVPDVTAISTEAGAEWDGVIPGDWNSYSISKLYEENSFISADGIPSNENWNTDSRQTGWYFSDCRFYRIFNVNYQGERLHRSICQYQITIAVYDQFLVIDGRRIDFLEYRPVYNFNLLTENIENGIRHTYECSFTFMERDFYVAVVNTITQQ